MTWPFHEHEDVLQFEGTRVYLRCVTCGRETPGWRIDYTPLRFRTHHQERMSKMGKWLALLKALAPAILATAGVPPQVTGVVINGMAVAQEIHDQGTGPSKKVFVQSLSDTVIDNVLALKPTLFNGTAAKTAVSEGIDTVAQAIKAAHAATPAVSDVGGPALSGL